MDHKSELSRMPFIRRMRIVWIDQHLLIFGSIRRSDICDAFGVTKAVASGDLRDYQRLCPGALTYDKSLKRYTASRGEFRLRISPSSAWAVYRVVKELRADE